MKQIKILIAFVLITNTFLSFKKTNSLEIGISNVLLKTFFLNENCKSDSYDNLLIKNDSIFVNGKIRNEYGNYTRQLNHNELKDLNELIRNINPKKRNEREINPTRGMTALLIKRNGKVADSLVDFTIEWNENDLKLFNYIGKIVCEKNLAKIKDSIIYPTWEMVKPPE
ncbi:hypothetical protein HX109_05400 [Galbibacter sp. BG1]|uniref:hypothetical protein n=1 Tax=Galbibacter sp. BG1 TaxID=1170699 RepID=UPI0015BF6506|nr:hypothetical protein [Galbibacter sp. BG1]QLE01028.1 hypothetical protein HX109_05400 [Galbibacter sp. BG1]